MEYGGYYKDSIEYTALDSQFSFWHIAALVRAQTFVKIHVKQYQEIMFTRVTDRYIFELLTSQNTGQSFRTTTGLYTYVYQAMNYYTSKHN